MKLDIQKKDNEIIIYKDNKIINNKKCFIIGKIENLNLLDKSKNTSDEKKVLNLFKKYKENLFDMLQGTFSLLIIDNKNIYAIRDKLGTHNFYYTNINNEIIISTDLSFIIKNSKKTIINKQALANYLAHTYIKAPNTILENVYKLSPGTYIKCEKNQIKIETYYNIKSFFKNNRNKIKNKNEAINIVEKDLCAPIKKNINNNDTVGIFFSAGVDSSLITALTKKYKNLNVNTYTIGFKNETIDETERAENIAKHLGTNHHKEYITKEDVIKIIHNYPNIYPEPFSDLSFIPTTFLHQITKRDNIDKILTGDGADQLFSGYYSDLVSLKLPLRFIKYLLKGVPIKYASFDPYNVKRYLIFQTMNIQSEKYYDMKDVVGNRHEKCMIYDINSFLADRLMTKVIYPAEYYNKNMIYPFLEEKTFKDALKIKFNIKWNKKKNKFVLREINNKYIPKELLNPKKNGFSAPVKNWTFMLKDEIKFYINIKIIKNQDLFNIEFIEKLLQKLDNKTIETSETRILFAIYLFEIWYQKNIKDLWK